MLGFSLGGRICGLVGDRVKSGPVGRITGKCQYPIHQGYQPQFPIVMDVQKVYDCHL